MTEKDKREKIRPANLFEVQVSSAPDLGQIGHHLSVVFVEAEERPGPDLVALGFCCFAGVFVHLHGVFGELCVLPSSAMASDFSSPSFVA